MFSLNRGVSSVFPLRVKVFTEVLRWHGAAERGPVGPCPPGPGEKPPPSAQSVCNPCPSYYPPYEQKQPPFYNCPRNRYAVNWIYVNDKPPSTKIKDFFDRAAQIIFWTEICRG